ncbi:MAG TPA: hypothetical protein VLV55_08665 [Rhizomicrobium sp.]|nr:hypothetical protein [Rhizomicrobium sp.]
MRQRTATAQCYNEAVHKLSQLRIRPRMYFKTVCHEAFTAQRIFAEWSRNLKLADRRFAIPPIVQTPSVAAGAVHEQSIDDFEAVRLQGVDFDAATFYGFLAEAMILRHHHGGHFGDLQVVLADAQAGDDEGANRMHSGRLDYHDRVDNLAI